MLPLLGASRRALPRSLLLALVAALLVPTALVSVLAAPASAADDGLDLFSRAAARNEGIPGLPAECIGRATRCKLGPQRAGAPTVVLWGDSHAWQLIPAVQAAIARRKVNLVGFIYGGCPPLHPGLDTRAEVRAAGECQRSNHKALRYVTNQHRKGRDVRVVLAAGWELYRYASDPLPPGRPGWRQHTAPSIQGASALMRKKTPRLFKVLGKKGVPTDVVGQMPTVPANAPSCKAGEQPYSCTLRRGAVLDDAPANRAYVQALRAKLQKPARYIDPTRGFCTKRSCPGMVGGESAYYDDTHISPSLSGRLGRFFEPTVEALVAASRR